MGYWVSKPQENFSYASMVGMLIYLASNSWPYISIDVHQCAQYSHNPKIYHDKSIKRIVFFFVDTKNTSLVK